MPSSASLPGDADVKPDSKASPQRGPEPQEARDSSKPESNDDSAREAEDTRSTGSDEGLVSEGENDVKSNAPPLPEGEEPPPLPVGEEPPPLPVGEEPPPLPVGEEPPPLPTEAPPDDGWEALWDDQNQAYYFHNKITNATQWENPRVPEANDGIAPHTDPPAPLPPTARPHGGYNPAIHGDYDPNADYAVAARAEEEAHAAASSGIIGAGGSGAPPPGYGATGAFNRFTGRWQAADQNEERHNDENKSRRQLNAFFDVDAAANSHGGRSLKAERQSKKLSKAELKAFKEKRREKKEEKRRAWLRD